MREPRAALFALLALAALPSAGRLFAQQEPTRTIAGSRSAAARNRTVYDGNWWLKADELTRKGFLDGIADYLFASGVKWMAWASTYDHQVVTEYYTRDRRNLPRLVPDAWKRVLTESPPPPPLPGGEVYEGPHGYYDGGWYRMGDIDERIAYLEGYLWCLRTYGKQPAAVYPLTLDYYDNKVWNYIQMRRSYYEPVAEILARFRSAVPNEPR